MKKGHWAGSDFLPRLFSLLPVGAYALAVSLATAATVATNNEVPSTMDAGGTAADPARYILDSGSYRDFTDPILLGDETSYNELEVTDVIVQFDSLVIGNRATSNGNSFRMWGNSLTDDSPEFTTIRETGNVTVGNEGSGNTLELHGVGSFFSVLRVGVSGNGNAVEATDESTFTMARIEIGSESGEGTFLLDQESRLSSFGPLILESGDGRASQLNTVGQSVFYADSITIGGLTGGNSIEVQGPTSALLCNSTMTLGSSTTTGNSLTVTAYAKFQLYQANHPPQVFAGNTIYLKDGFLVWQGEQTQAITDLLEHVEVWNGTEYEAASLNENVQIIYRPNASDTTAYNFPGYTFTGNVTLLRPTAFSTILPPRLEVAKTGGELLEAGDTRLLSDVIPHYDDSIELTLANRDYGNLVVSSVSLVGDDASDFILETSLPSTLGYDETAAVTVSMKTGTTGKKSVNLRVVSNDPTTPTWEYTLIANPTYGLSLQSIDGQPVTDSSIAEFPATSLEETHRARLVFENTGELPLSLGSPSVTSESPNVFALNSQSSGDSLNPGETVWIDVSFSPETFGGETGQLTIPDDNGTMTWQVQLRGNHEVLNVLLLSEPKWSDFLEDFADLGSVCFDQFEHFSSFDGSYDLDKVDAVYLVTSLSSSTQFSQAGQQALVDYVYNGGYILLSNNYAYNRARDSAYLPVLDAIAPVLGDEDRIGIPADSVQMLTPAPDYLDGLASSFSISPGTWVNHPKSGATLLYTAQSDVLYPAVVGWNYGDGTAVYSAIDREEPVDNSHAMDLFERLLWLQSHPGFSGFTPTNVALEVTDSGGNPILSGQSFYLGDIQTGQEAEYHITITNTGDDPLAPVIPELASPRNSDYHLEYDFAGILLADESFDVVLSFLPGSQGPQSQAFTIKSGDENNHPFQLTFKANFNAGFSLSDEKDLSLQNQDTIEFIVPSSGATFLRTLTLQNTGETDLTGFSAALDGDSAFTIEGTVPSTIPMGETLSITIAYRSETFSTDSATLLLSHDYSATPLTLNLASILLPLLNVADEENQTLASEDELDFGLSEPTAPTSRTITLANQGSAAMTGIELTLSGDEEFSFSGTLPSTLTTGSQQEITINHTAAKLERNSGTLTITYSGQETPFAIQLSSEADLCDIAVMESGSISLDQKVRTLLEVDPRNFLTFIPPEQFADPGPDWSAYDAIILAESTLSDANFEIGLQSQQGIVDFVNRGGVLISTQWLIEEIAAHPEHYSTLDGIIPASSLGQSVAIYELHKEEDDPYITPNFPDSFDTAILQGTEVEARRGTSILYTSQNSVAPVLVSQSQGGGIVFALPFDIDKNAFFNDTNLAELVRILPKYRRLNPRQVPEITVLFSESTFLQAGQSLEIDPTDPGDRFQASLAIRNDGTADLTDISLRLAESTGAQSDLLTDSEVDRLAPGETLNATLEITPTVLSDFRIQLEILSNDENESPFLIDFTGNSYSVRALLLTSGDTDKDQAIVAILEDSEEIAVDILSSEDSLSAILSQEDPPYDTLLLAPGPFSANGLSNDDLFALIDYTQSGGVLVLPLGWIEQFQSNPASFGNLQALLPMATRPGEVRIDTLNLDPSAPDSPPDLLYPLHSYIATFEGFNPKPTADVYLRSDDDGEPSLIAWNYGSGRVIAMSFRLDPEHDLNLPEVATWIRFLVRQSWTGAPELTVHAADGTTISHEGELSWWFPSPTYGSSFPLFVANAGTKRLDYQVALQASESVPGLAIQSPSNGSVPPGEQVELLLSFSGSSPAVSQNTISITTNDPATSPFQFDLVVRPESLLEFRLDGSPLQSETILPTLLTDLPRTIQIELVNSGPTDLNSIALALSGPGATSASVYPEQVSSLPSGATASLSVTLSGISAGDYRFTLSADFSQLRPKAFSADFLFRVDEDEDQDGIGDAWAEQLPTSGTASHDRDLDGYDDRFEFERNLDPLVSNLRRVAGFPDADADAFPDVFVETYDIDWAATAPHLDLDFDGLNFIEEYLTGGNPFVAEPFKIWMQGDRTIHFDGKADMGYELLSSSDLTLWHSRGEYVSPENRRFIFDVSEDPDAFWRAASFHIDTDGDGLSDFEERLRGLNPYATIDLDGNGLPDEWEIAHYGRTALLPLQDSDQDRIPLEDENRLGLNPKANDAIHSTIFEYDPNGRLRSFQTESEASALTIDTEGNLLEINNP